MTHKPAYPLSTSLYTSLTSCWCSAPLANRDAVSSPASNETFCPWMKICGPLSSVAAHWTFYVDDWHASHVHQQEAGLGYKKK